MLTAVCFNHNHKPKCRISQPAPAANMFYGAFGRKLRNYLIKRKHWWSLYKTHRVS